MEVDKRTPLNKSHEDTLSDPDHGHPLPRPPKKRARDKPKRHKVELRTAEGSEEDQQLPPAAHQNNHAADFGHAGEWPVDTKNDSAGPPVRADPAVRLREPEGGEKKESRKRPKEKKEKEEKKPPQQPSSSDNNKASSEKAGEGDCTTKRNLHLIKTERVGHRASDESHTAEDHEKKERRKKKKEKRSREKEEGDGRGGGEKRRSSGEKEREGKQDKRRKTKTRREVERESIHLSKQKEREKRAPKVERMALKPDNWHDVERVPLYDIIPQYANLPEDPAMKAFKQNPNANLYTQRSDPPNGRSVTEPTDKKAVTERDKKEQGSTGPAEYSEVSEKPSITADLVKVIKNPPCFIWIPVILLFLCCFCLAIGVIVQHSKIGKLEEELKRLREQNSTPRSP